jgi:hypothetical protein
LVTTPSDDFDSPWKEALDAYLPEFLALCAPWMFAEIEWSRGYDTLDQELIQVTRDAELGRRLADKLVRVWLLDGGDVWVLIHIEVQAQEEPDFAERMFVYWYRIFDQYRHRAVSIAVLADERPNWRPSSFSQALWRCETHFLFPIIKLLDWKERRDELFASDNPFATVLLAHLAAQETRGDVPGRQAVKLALIRRLYERGYGRDQILNLFRFIDWMLALPAAAAKALRADIIALEEEQHMPYITSIERIGIEQGLERGIEQGRLVGKLDSIRHVARVRFGAVPDSLERRFAGADDAALDALLDRVLTAATVEDL